MKAICTLKDIEVLLGKSGLELGYETIATDKIGDHLLLKWYCGESAVIVLRGRGGFLESVRLCNTNTEVNCCDYAVAEEFSQEILDLAEDCPRLLPRIDAIFSDLTDNVKGGDKYFGACVRFDHCSDNLKEIINLSISKASQTAECLDDSSRFQLLDYNGRLYYLDSVCGRLAIIQSMGVPHDRHIVSVPDAGEHALGANQEEYAYFLDMCLEFFSRLFDYRWIETNLEELGITGFPVESFTKSDLVPKYAGSLDGVPSLTVYSNRADSLGEKFLTFACNLFTVSIRFDCELEHPVTLRERRRFYEEEVTTSYIFDIFELIDRKEYLETLVNVVGSFYQTMTPLLGINRNRLMYFSMLYKALSSLLYKQDEIDEDVEELDETETMQLFDDLTHTTLGENGGSIVEDDESEFE